MAPEYAMDGQFSTKSDVFSFGVILLEIISGKKNNGSYLVEKSQTLIRYVCFFIRSVSFGSGNYAKKQHMLNWKCYDILIKLQAWQLWREGKELEFVDPLMMESSPIEDVIRCMHIGLLCVQEDPTDRPTVSSVVVLLGSGTISLPQPRQPAFCVPKVIPITQSSFSNHSVTGFAGSSVSSSTVPWRLL